MDAAESLLLHRFYPLYLEGTAPEALHPLYLERGGTADLKTFRERLGRMDIGLPAEDEFAVLLLWLGRCRIVHKLEQRYVQRDRYCVPDLLAIFNHEGHPLPVLIEVKARRKLELKPAYVEGLQRYSHELGIPVLLAWFEPLGQFWSLFELRHLQLRATRHSITPVDALRHSLMSALAGDFSYSLPPGFSLHLHIKKLGPETSNPEGGGSTFTGQVERAYYALSDGAPLEESRGWTMLFIGLDDEVEAEERGDSIHQRFTTAAGLSQLAHRVLRRWMSIQGGRIPWHRILERGGLPMPGPELEMAAREVARLGGSDLPIRFRPPVLPDFLT